MPAKSDKQATAARMALAAKNGDLPVSKLQGAAKDMYDSMSKSQLEDFTKVEEDGPTPITYTSMANNNKFPGKKLNKIKKLTPGATSHLKEKIRKEIRNMLYEFRIQVDGPNGEPPLDVEKFYQELVTALHNQSNFMIEDEDPRVNMYKDGGKIYWVWEVRSGSIYQDRKGEEDDDNPIYRGKDKFEPFVKQLFSKNVGNEYKLEIWPQEKRWTSIIVRKK